MKQILVVEDSTFFGRLLEKRLNQIPDMEVQWAQTREEARELLFNPDYSFDVGIAGYDLPDAPDGEVLEDFQTVGLSTLVFTGAVSDQVRQRVWSLGVVDYLLKEDAQNLEFLASTVERLQSNPDTGILVVDDSSLPRETLARLLRVHRYTVYEAPDGKKGLELLKKHKDIRLVITDFHMPEMDGFELTQAIRKNFSRNDLAIIGISAQGKGIMAARFLKCGANDFIIKQQFLTEEFYGRVTQILENLENISRIRKMATTDSLTGLANRRRFFADGETMIKKAAKSRTHLCCAMLDLDHFKRVNDTYGHDTGDQVLRHVSSMIKNHFPQMVLKARLGGEEFALLFPYPEVEATRLLESFRKKLEKAPVTAESGDEIQVTTSIGLAIDTQPGEKHLDDLLKSSDQRLYLAKENGRNRLVAKD